MRTKQISAAAIACTFLFSSPDAIAQSAETWSYETCLDNSGGVTAKMRECSGQEYASQDGRLNANYRRLMNAVPKQQKSVYRATQRAWIAYRDTTCDAETELHRDGTFALILLDGCHIQMTSDRADWLYSQARAWEEHQ